VYLYLNGGCDSYNMIVPHSQCPDKDMYAEYAQVRGDVALSQGSLLQVAVPSGT